MNEETKSALEIRNEHAKLERSLRAVAWFLWFDAAIMLLIGITFSSIEKLWWIGVLCLIVGVLKLAVGHGLNKLKSWITIPATISSVIGLISFPIGTLVGLYILSLIYKPETDLMFSDKYQEIINQTPEVNTTPSIIVRGLVGLIVIGVVLAIILLFVERLT